jgi:hypothetical protein
LPPEAAATSAIPAYSPGTLEFVRIDGSPLTGAEVRGAAVGVIDRSTAEAVADTENLLAGKLELGEWQANALARIKRLNISEFGVGVGGQNQITAEAITRNHEEIPETRATVETLGDNIAFQYGKLDAFAAQIEAGLGSSAEIIARVGLYGSSGFTTFSLGRKYAAMAAGFTEERNVLTPAEHCRAGPNDNFEDCPTQTANGWVKLGLLVPVGQRKCLMNCRCYLEYR